MKAFIDFDVLILPSRGERKALNLLVKLRDKEKLEHYLKRRNRNG